MTRRNWINTESPENGCIYNLNHDQTILIDCQCLFFFYLVKKSSGVRKSFKYLVQAKVWILTLAPKSTIILKKTSGKIHQLYDTRYSCDQFYLTFLMNLRIKWGGGYSSEHMTKLLFSLLNLHE